MGLYAQVFVPLLCDFGLDRPFVAPIRRELLAHADGNVLEIGFGTGLNLPCYPPHVRKVTAVDPNAGMYRRARRRIEQAGVEVDRRLLGGKNSPSRTAPSIAPSARLPCAASSRWTKLCGKCTAC